MSVQCNVSAITVQWLRHAHLHKGIFWSTEAVLARFPFWHHQWLTWVSTDIEHRLLG